MTMFRLPLFRRLKSARAVALAAVLSIGFSTSLFATAHGDLSREEIIAAVLAEEPGSEDALKALFNELSSDSEAIADLAVDLINSLSGDPVANAEVAGMISDIASETLSSQPIVKVSVGKGFRLPPGALGWDLGAPDSPLFEGFTKLTQKDTNIVSGSSSGVQRPGGEGLLSDGLINVKKVFFNVDVPDGFYRLILMTDNQGNPSILNPLGKSVTVNGVRTPMLGVRPSSWGGSGILGGSNAVGTRTGGATIIVVEIIGGRLVIKFEQVPGSNMLLTAIILEPNEGEGVLADPENVFKDEEEILIAEAIIEEALGESFADIVSAAGEIEPEFEVAQTVSEN